MNIFSRVLLTIYAFCLAIISVITMLINIKPEIFDTIYGFIAYDVLGKTKASVTMFIVAFIFFILSITFLLSGLRSNKDKKAVSKHTNIGEIKISLNTIESIALGASRKSNGIRDTKASVEKHDDNVKIVVRAVVMPDVNIPAISEDIQMKVKKSVEESSGISVSEVKVIVDDIHSGAAYRPRVE